MKLLQKILFLVGCVMLSIASTGTAYAIVNQIDLLNAFAAESWKQTQINSGGQNRTIEQHIVHAFNGIAWGPSPENTTKITQNLNADIRNYYNGTLADPANAQNNYLPANPVGWHNWKTNNPANDLATNDSPRQWMDKLDLRELYRFKDFIAPNVDIINNDNYATDDLVKARALSGIFWIVENNSIAYAAFSGMLKPGQPFAGKKRVYTCLHGFTDGNATDNVTYYFVPYGVKADGNSSKIVGTTYIANPDFVINKGFKVTNTYIDPDRSGTVKTVGIDAMYFTISKIGSINMYNKNDYAEVEIDERTISGKSLQDVLTGTTNPINTAALNLPNLNENDGTLAIVDKNNHNLELNENIFVIGNGNSDFALDNSIAVCSKVGPDGLMNPCRSLNNDESTKVPSKIGNHGELAASLPVYYAMSGGPILKCRLHNSDNRIKKCQIIGTIWGSERIFNGTNISGFRCFINRLNEQINDIDHQ